MPNFSVLWQICFLLHFVVEADSIFLGLVFVMTERKVLKLPDEMSFFLPIVVEILTKELENYVSLMDFYAKTVSV